MEGQYMTVADIRGGPRVAGHTRTKPMPTKTLKTSAPGSAITGPGSWNASSSITGLFRSYETLAYGLPFQFLDYIELLATYNPDYSQAVENIKTLANSGHHLTVNASSSLQIRRTIDLLEGKARLIQVQHGGIDGVIDKLLDQASVFGAMAGEWVVNDDLTDIVDFVDINPKSIRFLWDEKLNRYMPWQHLSPSQLALAMRQGREVANGSVPLNPLTFHYFAFDAAPESPYGTPPFLAALENIAIQRDMVDNMAQIVKKIGMLGIVDVIVKQLPALPGEKPDEYMTRAGSYLDSYVGVVQDMMRDGGLLHFDDMELKPTQIAGNAAGATNIFKQNEELVFSGLKSMPSVQGRSYSTTETYAGVAYDIIIRNTMKYQRGCKRMIEAGYWLIASLNGLNPTSITIDFNENKTLNRLQTAQAEAVEIRNALTKWLCGVIDQMGFAQELGYNDVKKEMADPPPAAVGESKVQPQGSGTGASPGDGGNSSGGTGDANKLPEALSEQLAAIGIFVEDGEFIIPENLQLGIGRPDQQRSEAVGPSS